jgi:hypothetical protein
MGYGFFSVSGCRGNPVAPIPPTEPEEADIVLSTRSTTGLARNGPGDYYGPQVISGTITSLVAYNNVLASGTPIHTVNNPVNGTLYEVNGGTPISCANVWVVVTGTGVVKWKID